MDAGVLQAADFYSRRHVDTGAWRALLAQEGYVATPEAEAVFANYGHLRLRIGFSDSLPNGNAELSFNEQDIMLACQPDYVEFWQKDIGRTLTPVAAVGVEEVLYVSENSHVYRSHFHKLYHHGAVFYESLRDSIVNTHQEPELVSAIP